MANKTTPRNQPPPAAEQTGSTPAVMPAATPSAGKKATVKVQPEDPAIRSMQIKYNFYKWFLGTFLIGAFTAVTTFILKEYEFKLKTRTEESTYLKPYLDNYMKLFGKNTLGYDRAADMAKFLSCSVVDKDYKAGWNDLFEYCQKRTTELRAKNDSITRDSIKNSQKIKTLTTNAQKINSVPGLRSPKADAELKRIQDSLALLHVQQASLVAEKTSNLNKINPQLNGQTVQPPAILTNSTQNPVSQQATDPNTETYSTFSDTTKYISKNYFQIFSKVFEIGVNSVNPGKQTCNVTLYTLVNGKFKVLEDDLDLDLNQQIMRYSPDQQYRFQIEVVRMYRQGLRNYATFHVIVSKKPY